MSNLGLNINVDASPVQLNMNAAAKVIQLNIYYDTIAGGWLVMEDGTTPIVTEGGQNITTE